MPSVSPFYIVRNYNLSVYKVIEKHWTSHDVQVKINWDKDKSNTYGIKWKYYSIKLKVKALLIPGSIAPR